MRPPPRHIVDAVVRNALSEDLGEAGDITTTSLFPAEHRATAQIVARRAGRVAGIGIACRVFGLLDATTETVVRVPDGTDALAGDTLAELAGSTRAILTGERVALNLLGHLSGIATVTRDVVAAIAGSGADVVDTRKTTPGLRSLEKYAVRCGGGRNHRMGLYDAVMIKDNHVAAAGSLDEAVKRVRAEVGHMVKIEVEIDRVDQVAEALAAGVDVILFDNFTPAELAEAVALTRGAAITEASGGITPETAAEFAATGVDVLSLGWLTHSASHLDVALEVV